MATLKPEVDVIMDTFQRIADEDIDLERAAAEMVLADLKAAGYIIVPEALRPYTNWRTLAGLAQED